MHHIAPFLPNFVTATRQPNAALERLAHAPTDKGYSPASPLQALFYGAVASTTYLIRRYLSLSPSISKYANLPGMHDTSAPASMPTISDRAMLRFMSLPSRLAPSAIT